MNGARSTILRLRLTAEVCKGGLSRARPVARQSGMRRFLFVVGLLLAAAFTTPTSGRTAGVPYPQMGPLGRYLMTDRQAEIELARTGAPPAISHNATVLVLTTRGYETARRGSNGFTCLVERSWMSPFSSSEFWNYKNRSPICYNPPAPRSVLLYTLRRARLVVAGTTKAAMLASIRAAVARKELPVPEPGSMSYMLSKQGYLADGAGAWMPHVMIYAPRSASAGDGASWGANLPGSPVVFDTQHHIVPEPETIFMIPVAHWSDGTVAPKT